MMLKLLTKNVLDRAKLFSFASFSSWSGQAQKATQVRGLEMDQTLCIDQKGRVCSAAKHFVVAREESAFPIDVYQMLADPVLDYKLHE